MPVAKPREIAVRILLRVEQGREYTETLLDEAMEDSPLPPVDRGLLQEIVCGVVRWRAALDWVITRRTEGRPQKAVLQVLLRVGLYQAFWLDRIPPHAVVHETVELGKQLGCGPQAGFLNAVLRGCLRDATVLRQELEALRKSDPATGWSHPAWLVDRWRAQWTPEEVESLLRWNNTPPATYARVNALTVRNIDALREQWAAERVDAALWMGQPPADWLRDTLVFELKQHAPLSQLGSLRLGRFYVQDPSTLLAVHLLNPQPGETVLDACAAPGGKTTYLAQRMQNQGRIVAEDPEPDRLGMVTENCRRLGATIVETRPAPPAEDTLRFHRILVDAPCSNTGVLRRRLDLRWRIRSTELERLTRAQRSILDLAATRLLPGGVIAYSTCSLEPEENSAVVAGFLGSHPEFKLQQERTLLPFRHGVDGAYCATLRRAS